MSALNLSRYCILDFLLEGCQVVGFDWRYLYVNHAVAQHARRSREELLSATMTELYPGIEQTPTFAVLRRCMEQRVPDQLENEFAYPDGSKAWFDLRVEPVPEGLFVLSLDITARKLAERRTERHLERLRSLRAIDLAILGTTDLRVTLRAVLEESVKGLRADAACVLLLKGSTRLDAAGSIGFRSPEADRLSIRLGDGAIGRAALDRRTVLISADEAGPVADAIPPALGDRGAATYCAVPLVAKGHLTGVLVVAQPASLDEDDDWINFLEALAGQAAIAIDAGRSFEDLQRAHLELALAYDTTIEGWGAALELRDKETAHHTLRVADLTMQMARAAGMSDAELLHVRRGALLHDIGKMAIPDSILLKKDTLTEDEHAVMKTHPARAYELLLPIAYLRPALDIPYCHHERWDGTGYPRGLKGTDIPLAARLFTVVDVWDAIRSRRPYRESWSDERAREHLLSLAGTALDPAAVDLFLGLIDRQGTPSST